MTTAAATTVTTETAVTKVTTAKTVSTVPVPEPTWIVASPTVASPTAPDEPAAVR
jgi:hypothetical protein